MGDDFLHRSGTGARTKTHNLPNLGFLPVTVTLDTAKAHLNVTIGDDDSLITAQIAGAVAYVENQLGFAIDDATQFPDGTPADLDQAMLMMVAHWYANRETVIATDSRAVAIIVPLATAEIVAEYRNYTFGLAC